MPRKLLTDGKMTWKDIRRRTDKCAEVLAIANQFKSEVKTQRSTLDTAWGRWYKLYLGTTEDAKYEGLHNLDPKIILQQVETIVGFYCAMLFGAKDFYDITPVEETDVKIAALRKLILDWQLNTMEYQRKIKDGIRLMLILGTHIFKAAWTQSEPRSVVVLGRDGKPKVKNDYIYDMLDVVSCKLQNVYFDPTLTDDEFLDADIIVHEGEKSVNSLLKDKNVYDVETAVKRSFSDWQKKKDPARNPQFYKKPLPAQETADYKGLAYMSTIERPQSHIAYVKVNEVWLKYDLDGDGIAEPCKALIVDDHTVINLQHNPYWFNSHPFIKSKFLPVAGSAYGRGVADVNEDNHNAAKEYLNHALDICNFIINNEWITTVNACISDDQLVSRPGKVYRSRSTVGDLVPMPKPNIMPDAMNGVTLCTELAKLNSGATDTLQGMALGQRTSATEAKEVYNAAFRRMIEHVKDFELAVTKPYILKAMRIDDQLMDEAMFMRIAGRAGQDWKTGYPGSIVGDFDVNVYGVTMMENSMVTQNKLLGFFNMISRIPPQLSGIKLPALIKVIYEGMGRRDFAAIQAPEAKEVMPMKPEDENILIEQGEILEPTVYDPHPEHLVVHHKGVKTNEMLIHIGLHEKMYQEMSAQQGPGQMQMAPQSQSLGSGSPGAGMEGGVMTQGAGQPDFGSMPGGQ